MNSSEEISDLEESDLDGSKEGNSENNQEDTAESSGSDTAGTLHFYDILKYVV